MAEATRRPERVSALHYAERFCAVTHLWINTLPRWPQREARTQAIRSPTSSRQPWPDLQALSQTGAGSQHSCGTEPDQRKPESQIEQCSVRRPGPDMAPSSSEAIVPDWAKAAVRATRR